VNDIFADIVHTVKQFFFIIIVKYIFAKGSLEYDFF